jgi:cold shock CspA family protein
MSQTGIVPNDRLFCHWRNVQSDDRFPFLVKGLEVEFGMEKVADKWNPNLFTLRAKDVTLIGGMNVAVQDDIDAQQKEFVGGQHLRYTGTLKFFNPKLGFGYVTMDQGYDVEPGTPSELRVEGSEVNAGGRNPLFMQNLAVEFGIWKTPRFMYKIYNMTLPGGHPLTQDALENRISMGPQSYRGEITMWNWRAGWGFLRVDASMPLPPRVTVKLQAQAAAARQRGRQISEDSLLYFRRVDCAFGYAPQRASQVQFQLYIDDKGAGACEVNSI